MIDHGHDPSKSLSFIVWLMRLSDFPFFIFLENSKWISLKILLSHLHSFLLFYKHNKKNSFYFDFISFRIVYDGFKWTLFVQLIAFSTFTYIEIVKYRILQVSKWKFFWGRVKDVFGSSVIRPNKWCKKVFDYVGSDKFFWFWKAYLEENNENFILFVNGIGEIADERFAIFNTVLNTEYYAYSPFHHRN